MSYARPSYYAEGYITPTDVKDYAYCPAIPWIRRVHGIAEPPTPSMEDGRAGSEEKLAAARELGLPGPHRVEVYLRSGRLRLHGVVDVLAGSRGRLAVLEVKRVRRILKSHRAQLAAYALLAEDTVGGVRVAVLHTPAQQLVVEVTGDLLSKAERLVEAARAAAESEEPPEGAPGEAKCLYCYYRSVCPVRP